MNDRLRILQRQPRRISITLSYHVHEALLSRSEEEGRSVSNLCAFLLEEALRARPPFLQFQSPNGDGPLLRQFHPQLHPAKQRG
ncbi:hypothetical protein KBZ07_07715 [Cyanobium sp. BA20m-14]|nr:hypothetical protein [Cyanobium sp. BA20m-14]